MIDVWLCWLGVAGVEVEVLNRMLAVVGKELRHVGVFIDLVVGTKLGKWEPLGPVVLNVFNISLKVLFNEGVRVFGMAVGVGVVRSRVVVVDFEPCAQLLKETGNKL